MARKKKYAESTDDILSKYGVTQTTNRESGRKSVTQTKTNTQTESDSILSKYNITQTVGTTDDFDQWQSDTNAILGKWKKTDDDSSKIWDLIASGSKYRDLYKSDRQKLDRIDSQINALSALARNFPTKEAEDDIAPVTTTKKEEKKGLFDGLLAPLDDGWDSGDVMSIILEAGDRIVNSDTADWLGKSALSGLASFNKGITSTADVLLGKPLQALGWKDNPISSVADYYSEQYDIWKGEQVEATEKMGGGKGITFAGDLVEGSVAALPNMLAMIMTGGASAAPTATTLANQAASATGNILTKAGITVETMAKNPQFWLSFGRTLGTDYEEAKANGASDLSAAFGSTLSSLVNAGIEIGIDGGSGIQGLMDDGGKNAFVSWAESALEEGGEEVLQGFVNNVVSKILYNEDTEVLNLEDMLKEFALGTGVGALLGGGQKIGQTAVNAVHSAQAQKEAENARQQLTENEQKVVDKVYNDLVAEQEESGKKLTETQKKKIYNEVLTQMEKGYISTDTIEEVLGGESFKTYRDTLDSEDAILNEYKELGKKQNATLAEQARYNELSQQVKDIQTNSQRNQLKSQLSGEVMGLVKSDRLAESYNERFRRSQAFEADLSQYDVKQQQTIQKAIDSGILNNTNRTHEFVDMVAKISADKGVLFDFTNNQKLKESGFAVDGKTVNGYVTKDGITVNIQSAKSLNSIVGHEITHVLEGTEFYNTLSEAVKNYAISKEGLDSFNKRLKATEEMYKGMDGTTADAELTADLIGDYLFTDSDFINRLSTENRNVFQKIYDEIKYLCRVATAGSKEARELEKVKKAFEDAYRANNTEEATDVETDDVQYSMSVKDEETLDFLNEQVSRGEYDAETNPDGGYYVTYKSMSFWGYDEDGNAILRSPMAEYVDGELSNAYLIPKDKSKLNWYQATETIDEKTGFPSGLLVKTVAPGKKSPSYLPAAENQNLINDDWSNLYFNLRKKVMKNGKWTTSDVPARYNPYEHSSNSMLNDQFSAAYLRDNLVTVKMYVPVSEDNGTFRAKWSKDATGWTDWKAGIVAGKINQQKDLQRRVYLSRYAAPVEIVPDSEVAQAYKEYLDGTDVAIPDNVVSPGLLNELKNAGVPIKESGKVKYSISDSEGKQLTSEQQEYFKDSKMRDENGNLKVMYHGSQDAGFHTFDSRFSDDGTSFFFVDRNEVAQSYSGTTEVYEAQTIRTAEEMNNFLQSIGEEDYKVVEENGKFTLYQENEYVADSDTAQGIYEEYCDWVGVGYGDANYKVYLNLKNPLVVDAEGRNWDNVSQEYSQELYEQWKADFTAEEKAALVDLAEWDDYSTFKAEIERAVRDAGKPTADEYTKLLDSAFWKNSDISSLFSMAQDNFSDEVLKENAIVQYTTRDFAQRAKEQGYDGVIFKNIHDNGGYSNGSEGASTVAIAFDSNQIKSTANAKPTGDADIRYSLSEDGQEDVQVMDGGTVTKYSLSTWTPETQTRVRNDLVKAGFDEDHVDKWIKDTNSIASVIAADRDRLDFVAADNQTMLKPNQEYVRTLDASTLCAKRLVYQGTFDAIQHRMPNTMLSSDDLIELLNMMKEHGVQTPCGVCYVESRRRHLGKFAQEWLDGYTGEYKPRLDEVTTSDGLETLRKTQPVAYEDFMTAMKKKGSANPKVVQLRTEYRNDIMSLTPAQIRKIESIGGLRVQSFSDFETPHLLDMMQAVMDMSAKGLTSQAYTKVPNFAWVFGDTGIKINLSLIAEGNGFDADGNLAFSSVEGMDINEAMALRDAYSQNVGTIIVGANDRHILACMADDRIDFIIPFHRSGWGQKELSMMGMDSYTDYTYGQNEHDLETGKGVANLYPPDYWDYNASGKENAERYLNLCARLGREPKFSQFLVNNGDGSYSLQPDGSTDGYWKTLIDFKMYDNDGIGAAQQKVQPNFNMEQAYRVLNEYEGGANVLPVANDVVEEFVAKYQSYEELAPAMSLSEIGEQPKRYGNYNIYGKDIGIQDPLADFAPVTEETEQNVPISEDVAPVTEGTNASDVLTSEPVTEVTEVTDLFPDDLAPVQDELDNLVAEEADMRSAMEAYASVGDIEAVNRLIPDHEAIKARIKELQQPDQDRIDSLSDADIPPEMEAPYAGESEPVTVENPFEDRDWDDVGDRKVKAYMYENPEVKPFFQEEAAKMLWDLADTTKAERWYNDQLHYESGGEAGFGGNKRHTSADIATLLDGWGMSYADIEKGLNAIIEDHGAENIAAAKRLEFMLNDRLLNGYKDFHTGDMVAPNQDYINLLNEKQITEYGEEAFNNYLASLGNDMPPEAIAEDIAPVAEAYEAIRPKREKQPRLIRVDTETVNTDSMKGVLNGQETYITTEDKLRTRNRDIAPVRPVRADSEEGKQRKWVETSTESEVVNREILPEDLNQSAIHYQPISNKKTLGNANAKLDSMGYDASVAYFNSQFNNKQTSLDDIALGERLIQEAMKKGDYKTAGELIQNVAILGTELGQKVQALSIIKRLTPEGQLGMLQKVVQRGKTKGDPVFDGVEVTQDMIEQLLKVYNKDGSFDKDKLNKAVEDVKKQIADQMQVTKMEKVNAWRYLSMLGNPKTHIRNLVSNVAMKGTVAVKNAVARTVEDIAPIQNRTKTWKAASADVKAFAQRKTMEMKDIISGDSKYSDSASIKDKRAIFKNKILNGLYEFNSDMLGKEDWWFSKGAFQSSLSEFLTANGISTKADIKKNPEIVEKGLNYALEQSQIATFRQYSWLANKINEIERKNAATQIAVGSILPFKKTPVNIAKTGLNYSPLGFAKTLTYDISQVKKGNMEASELVDHLAQNVTGSALTLVGYMLAQSGLLNGAGEDDKEGEYDYQLGEQSYSINIGDATYSLSWLSPVAMPLFVGANMYEQLVEGKEWNGDVVVQTLAQTLDPLSEMSFISSLDSVLSSYDSGIMKFAGIAQTGIQSYVGQFVPTLSSQIATVMDDTKRTTKVAADSEFKFFDEVINSLKYKIPGLRETLEPTTDIWGNEVKQTEDVLTRAFETFLAPYAKREDIATAIDEEIKALYGETGDDGLIPSVPYNYINYDGEKYEMSASEFTDYKKLYGQAAFDLMEELFDTETYQNADSETRAEMVNMVYDYARDNAKKEFFDGRGVSFTNATKEGEEYYKENAIKGAIENDMPVDEYKFSIEYPEKYKFLTDNGVTYNDYQNGSEDFKDAYSWAFNNPDKYTLSKAISSDLVAYRKYSSELYDIRADKDENGKSISGSAKEKKIDYINGLDLEYGERIILFKSLYEADDTYNYEIIDYLNSRDDISYEEMETILKELGFNVDSSGNITWD